MERVCAQRRASTPALAVDTSEMVALAKTNWPLAIIVAVVGIMATCFGVNRVVVWLFDPTIAAGICLLAFFAEQVTTCVYKLLFEDDSSPPLHNEALRPWAGDTGDALWHINGNRYDLDAFVRKHPGGRRAILLGKGKECTALFRSYHTLTDLPDQVLNEFLIDHHGVRPYFTWNSDSFSADIAKAFRQYFRSHGLRPTATSRAQIYLVCTCLCFLVAYGLLLRGWWVGVFLAPVLYWLSGSAMLHDGLHFAISPHPWVNDLCAALGSAHTSPLMWQQQHVVAHHQYPNHCLFDPDLHHFRRDTGVIEKELGWRCHPGHEHLVKYKSWRLAMMYVPLWTTFGISLIHDPIFFLRRSLYDIAALPRMSAWRRVGHLVGRCLVFLFGVYTPMICVMLRAVESDTSLGMFAVGIAKSALFVVLPWGIHGIIYFFFSQVSHINEECCVQKTEVADEMHGDWATHHVLSTWDYSVASPCVGTLANGLNNQIVHHLCPNVHPCHFVALAPIVASVAEKHGIDVRRRQRDSLPDALRRTLRWLAAINDQA